MSDFLEKISSYHFFNYLLPGALFASFGEAFTSFQFIQKDLVIGLFVYYFIGLVISRVGSLFLEPTLKRICFVKFEPYQDFVDASKQDTKLNELSESNNMYRTLSALFLCLLLLQPLAWAINTSLISQTAVHCLTSLALFALFLFSYRKQTKYICRRIISSKEKE